MGLELTVLFYSIIFTLSLCVGSFINVAVYRIPKMLFFDWFLQCYEFLNLQPKFKKAPSLGLNLFFPSSHCPSCQKKICLIDNIPIISYCFLKGRCRNCQQKISIKYPITEMITASCSLIVAWKFGVKLELVFALLVTWTLILQAGIDFQESLIPDEITLPMLWLGLIINNFNVFVSLQEAVIGSIVGYLIFWVIYWLFKIVTGKDGIGQGDFKLIAMLGAWFGYKTLPLIVLLSTTMGSLVGGILILLKKYNKDSPIPFGPYLAIAGWVVLLWGNAINKWYWQ
jgi:leader peptidase (prepilin peptidase)/N-methyltransferase